MILDDWSLSVGISQFQAPGVGTLKSENSAENPEGPLLRSEEREKAVTASFKNTSHRSCGQAPGQRRPKVGGSPSHPVTQILEGKPFAIRTYFPRNVPGIFFRNAQSQRFRKGVGGRGLPQIVFPFS